MTTGRRARTVSTLASRWAGRLALALAGGALAGCMGLGYVVSVPVAAVAAGRATALPRPDTVDPPGTREHPRELAGAPRVALVLGGGSMRGFAHLGVLAELERAGFRPDLVVGASAGSLVGGLWASGLPAAQVERVAAELDWSILADLSLPYRGLVGGDRLEDFARRHLAVRNIEAMPMPFAAVATDVRTGDAVLLDRGDAAVALRASSSIPVLFEPVSVGGRLLADGGLSAPTPVRAARSLGADVVIAVNVAWSPDEASLRTPVDMLFQAMQVMGRNLNREELARADVVIEPDIRSLGPIDLSRRGALVAEGSRSGRAAIPAIRQCIDAWRAREAHATLPFLPLSGRVP